MPRKIRFSTATPRTQIATETYNRFFAPNAQTPSERRATIAALARALDPFIKQHARVSNVLKRIKRDLRELP